MQRIGALAVLLCAVVGCSGQSDVETEEPTLAVDRDMLSADNGIIIGNGLNLGNGIILGNGVVLSDGLNLGSGVDFANGIDLAVGSYLDGEYGPYYAPAPGSDLEKWIDVNPRMHKRIIRYLLECSLPMGKRVRVKYRGGMEVFVGVANLGPSLRNGALSVADQERVSACLLSRVNTAGRIVNIQLVGPYAGFDSRNSAEKAGYPIEELNFYGNLFLPSPAAFACSPNPTWGASRACLKTDGTSDCGILAVAPCGTSVCSAVATTDPATGESTGRYVAQCQGGGRAWANPMTVYVARKPVGTACTFADECQSLSCGASIAGRCE